MRFLLQLIMMRKTIEEELACRGCGLFQTVGDSMEPLLHNRKSTVAIKAVKMPLKRYDVALYRRPSGEYVLHRVIRVLHGKYLIRGDNRVWREKVPEEWVIGVMYGYYSDESDQFISCQDAEYQKYLKTLPLRYVALKLREYKRRTGAKLRKLFKQGRREGNF